MAFTSCFRYAVLSVLVIIMSCVDIGESAASSKDSRSTVLKRSRRSLYEFGKMINCATNKSEIAYSFYGCWCGYGGGGRQVDAVDTCCYIHDKCYDDIIASGICGYSWEVYLTQYEFRGCTTCEPESSYPADDGYKACRVALCACDSAAAKCFAASQYNPVYYYYNSSGC